MQKAIFFLIADIFLSMSALAQQKENSEDHDVFIYELPDLPTLRPDYDLDQMPNEDITSFSIDQQTGELIYFIDPTSKLYFNFRDREIIDFETGEEYSFDNFSELLKKKAG